MIFDVQNLALLATIATLSPAFAARPLPERIYGVTTDNVTDLPDIVDSLSKLPRRAVTRIVFDEGQPASYYLPAVKGIGRVSYVMGELLDSFYVKHYNFARFKAHADDYFKALRGKVDLWEIGNEINGDWLGNANEVARMMVYAFDKAKAQKEPAALTLYYNIGCAKAPEWEMYNWMQAHIPARMRTGLDYVWVSYYEDDCEGPRPNWSAVFNRLGRFFPNAKLGMGEVGTEHAHKKAEFLKRYYAMDIKHPRFVGGYFWWYFHQDMVPATKPLWPLLRDVFAGSK